MPNDAASQLHDRRSDERTVVDVHISVLQELFNPLDPSPMRSRALSDNVEDYIVSHARQLPRNRALGLVVQLDEPATGSDTVALTRDAVCAFFARRARTTRRRLQHLLRLGRSSLAIGLIFLALVIAVGTFVETMLPDSRLGTLLSESLVIGGWVAMWRPLDIFLYDWWPILSDARLYERLSAMPVQIVMHSHSEVPSSRGGSPDTR